MRGWDELSRHSCTLRRGFPAFRSLGFHDEAERIIILVVELVNEAAAAGVLGGGGGPGGHPVAQRGCPTATADVGGGGRNQGAALPHDRLRRGRWCWQVGSSRRSCGTSGCGNPGLNHGSDLKLARLLADKSQDRGVNKPFASELSRYSTFSSMTA